MSPARATGSFTSRSFRRRCKVFGVRYRQAGCLNGMQASLVEQPLGTAWGSQRQAATELLTMLPECEHEVQGL